MILRSLKASWKDFLGGVQFILREKGFFFFFLKNFSPTSVDGSQLVE